jgi:hypothetical protein
MQSTHINYSFSLLTSEFDNGMTIVRGIAPEVVPLRLQQSDITFGYTWTRKTYGALPKTLDAQHYISK